MWDPAANTCIILHTQRSVEPVTITLVEDFILLALMLSGLRRYGEAGMFGLWRFLYYQVSGNFFHVCRNEMSVMRPWK
jgi:hypothetical protein